MKTFAFSSVHIQLEQVLCRQNTPKLFMFRSKVRNSSSDVVKHREKLSQFPTVRETARHIAYALREASCILSGNGVFLHDFVFFAGNFR